MWKGASKFFISFCKEIRKFWTTDGISIWLFLLKLLHKRHWNWGWVRWHTSGRKPPIIFLYLKEKIILHTRTSTDGERCRYSPRTSHSTPGHVSQPTALLVSAPQLDDQPGLSYSPLRHLQKKITNKTQTKHKQTWNKGKITTKKCWLISNKCWKSWRCGEQPTTT